MPNEQQDMITIGVLIDSVHEMYQSNVWKGIVAQAKAKNINLLSFVGTSQDGIDHFDTHYDVATSFATKKHLDGVIVFSGSIVEHQSIELVRDIIKQFNDTPVVCLSEQIDDYPSILVENGSGVKAVIDHLVTVHNHQNIAFVKGPDGHTEALERFNAYKEGLKNNNIEFNPSLVCEGGFLARDGVKAVKKLINSKTNFDAIVAVGDDTALGVIEELTSQDIHVPGKIAVVGFDDVPDAFLAQPSLSTVRQPLFEMGVESINNIINQINKNPVEQKTILPTQPVFRRSCGCFSKKVENAKAIHRHMRGLGKNEIVENIFETSLNWIDKDNKKYIGDTQFKGKLIDLIESLIWDVEKPVIRNIFLNQVDMLLFDTEKFCSANDLFTSILKNLMVYVTSLFSDQAQLADANNILQQAQTMVREHQAKKIQKDVSEEKQVQLQINVTSQRIISSFERREFLDSVTNGLPTLGIDNFVIGLFGANGINRSTWKYKDKIDLLLAHKHSNTHTQYPRSSRQIIASDLFPTDFESGDTAYNRIFMPLYFHDEYIGYTVLEYAPVAPLFMYEELRLHISSAIKSSMLLRKFKTQSMTDEMTGVLNRRGFLGMATELLENMDSKTRSFCVFYADVDGLKFINDKYGHDDGDIIISEAAIVLKTTFRECDVISRFGGDEFVVAVASSIDEDMQLKIQKRFEDNIKLRNEMLNKPYKLSITLGYAKFDKKIDQTITDVMKRADKTLIDKKNARRSN